MNKKRIGVFIAAVLMLSVFAATLSLGAYEEKLSSIDSYESFYGSTRDYLYRDVGYKYKNCTCSVPGAYMYTTLRMKTGAFNTWQSKGKVKSSGVNGARDVWYGYTYYNANTTGKTKAGQYHFEPRDNSWSGTPWTRESIQTNDFIMYSQQ